MSVFAFDMVVLADAANQANRRSVSTGLTINGECLVQIDPDRAEPEVSSMQKHEFGFLCSCKLFCRFNAGYNPFAEDLDQVFEDAIFVSVNCACSGICIQGTQALIEVQKSSPRYVICFCFAEYQVDLDKRPLFREVGEHSEYTVTE